MLKLAHRSAHVTSCVLSIVVSSFAACPILQKKCTDVEYGQRRPLLWYRDTQGTLLCQPCSASCMMALKEAGVSEEKARKAAEAVASYDTRFATLDGKVETLRAELKGEMAWVKWMLG